MKLRTVAFSIVFVFSGILGTMHSGIVRDNLPPTHKKWLNEDVIHIITQKEKEVFLKLDSNQERELFIEAFWRQRDPNPETPVNEFKNEHYRRIEYANKMYGVGTSKPGWKTERGRIYIILGKPVTVETYGALEHNLVPLEVWFYQGNYGPGIPTSFYMLFFKEWGIGDFVLYSPIRHGPRKLIETYDVNPNKALNILRQVNPELANVARSLIPSQSGSLDAGSAVPSEMLLNNISVLPQKQIKDQYAEKLLKYRALVEVDHSILYVENDALVKIMRDEAGFFFVHYAVEPKRLSLGKYEEKYYTNLEIFGKIDDLQGNTIYQFERKVSLDFDEDQVSEMRSKLFSFQDAFPLIPGDFHFDLLIKNTVSKEFTSVEQDIEIPVSSGLIDLSPIVFSNGIEMNTSPEYAHKPFQFGRIHASPSANNTYSPGDNLSVCFKLYGLTESLKQEGFFEYHIFKEDVQVSTFRKAIKDYENTETFVEAVPLADYNPGYYLLKVSLWDGNQKEMRTITENFVISPAASLPRYWSVSEVYPGPDDPYYAYTLGCQMRNRGDLEKAVLLLEMANSKRPASLEFAVALADAYYAFGEYSKVQNLMSLFLEKAKEEPGVFQLLGNSFFKAKDYAKAIYYFKKYLTQFGTHIEILNTLGECYVQTGNVEEAIAAWERSLELSPDQTELREKTTSLRKKN